MKIRMKLISDSVFGNGTSIPGGEDISVMCDSQGFPYFKGSTLKGLFRDQLEQYLAWTTDPESQTGYTAADLLGFSGDDRLDTGKLVFSDLVIPASVKSRVLQETGDDPETVLHIFTHLRTFTALDDEGNVKNGSLRMARCINRGLSFTGELYCRDDQKELVKEVLSLIKWTGTMRNRGFGKVTITVEGEE